MSTSRATRTSSDAIRERAAELRLQRGAVRFRRGLIGAIAVLVLACAGLGTASVLQGPRIQGAQLDLAGSVAAPGLLRIVMDEAIAPITEGDVTIKPAVPAAVQVDGPVVLLQFERALDYDTRYSVELAGVSAAGGGVVADVRHEFRTPPFSATWLERSPAGDRILAGTPGGEPEVLHTGPGIQDFLPLPGALFVVRQDSTGAAFADIVATDGTGNLEQLVVPDPAPSSIELPTLVGTDVLYTFSTLDPGDAPEGARVFDDTLFRLDLQGTHISEPVMGLDGLPLAVDSLVAIPGTTSVLVHTRAGDLLRYDPSTGEPPTLLAAFAELGALAGDGRRVAVKDAFGQLIYDLDDGAETRVEPSPVEATGVIPFVADVIPMDGGRLIHRVALPNADFTSFDVFVGLDDGTSTEVLFRMPEAGSILGYRLTANERFLVTEVSPGGDRVEASDGYPVDARPRDVVTLLIDIDSGETIAQWTGSHARW